MLLAVLIGAGAIASAQAQQAFQSSKAPSPAARADDSGDAADPAVARDDAEDIDYDNFYDFYAETNEDCEDDVEVKLRWDRAADLDLRVEGPGMCKISFGDRVSKWGGVLINDAVPEVCVDGAPFEEVVRFGNGVANGGIFAVDANYFSDGGCDTGAVDFTITVTMGGKLVDTFEGTLERPDDTSEQFYVLGFRSNPTRRHSCAKPRTPEPPVPTPVPSPPDPTPTGSYGDVSEDDHDSGRRSLLSYFEPHHHHHEHHHRRRESKCACFHGKTVNQRGTCTMEDFNNSR